MVEISGIGSGAVRVRSLEEQLDDIMPERLFPKNLVQIKIDELADQIKEVFSPLVGFDAWLKENNATHWYSQLATYLVKLPPKSAWNIITSLYGVTSAALYIGVHPVDGTKNFIQQIGFLLQELAKPTNWAIMGAGTIGTLVAEGFVFGGPIAFMGFAIGGALVAGGVSADIAYEIYNAESGKEIEVLSNRIREHAKTLPDALLTGLFTGLFIGGMRRAISSSESLPPVEETQSEKIQPQPQPLPIEDEVHILPHPDFEKVANVAQYKWSDWSGLVDQRNVSSLEEAKQIAMSNPKIDYFFYMKTGMILENHTMTGFRRFYRGDAVFFSGKPLWGSAFGMADGFIKL